MFCVDILKNIVKEALFFSKCNLRGVRYTVVYYLSLWLEWTRHKRKFFYCRVQRAGKQKRTDSITWIPAPLNSVSDAAATDAPWLQSSVCCV